VNWKTNELATTKLLWGVSPNTNNTVADDGVFVTSHSVHVTGLSPNTVYTVRPAGTDRAGNAFLGGIFSVRTGN
jgi:carbohydrate-selective porin OprB